MLGKFNCTLFVRSTQFHSPGSQTIYTIEIHQLQCTKIKMERIYACQEFIIYFGEWPAPHTYTQQCALDPPMPTLEIFAQLVKYKLLEPLNSLINISDSLKFKQYRYLTHFRLF